MKNSLQEWLAISEELWSLKVGDTRMIYSSSAG